MNVKITVTESELAELARVCEELREYHATGYTPEQVQELHDKHWMECMQIANYDDDLQITKTVISQLQKHSGWIPCKDRYPDEDVVVLAYTVTDTQKIAIESAYWNNEEGWCSTFGGENMSEYSIEVTHWMPLPEPPAEKAVQT